MAGIPIASGFLLNAQTPIDQRTLVDTYSDLENMPTIQRHAGLMAYVEDEDKHYSLKSDLVTWELLQGGSGTGSGSVMYTDTSESTIQVGGINVGFKISKPIPLEKMMYLALHAGSTDIVKPPVLVQSSYDGISDVPISTEYITFDINNDINTVVKDKTKVTSNPSGFIKDVTIVGTKLYVYFNNPLNVGTVYDIKVDIGTIANEGDDETSFGEAENNSTITCSFETEFLPYPNSPTVQSSTSDGLIDQPISLSEITFLISDTFNLSLGNISNVTSIPSNIINSVTLVGDVLHVGLNNLANLTTYTVNIGQDVVENNGDNITTQRSKGNDNTVTCTFKTIAPAVPPPIIQAGSLNNATEVSINTNEVVFNISNIHSTVLKDGTKVTCSSNNGSSITIGNATYDSSTHTLHVPITNIRLDYSTTYTISVLSGILENFGDGVNTLNSAVNTSTVSLSFSTTTKPKPIIPLVGQSSVNNTTVVSVNLSEVVFQITNDFNLSMADATKVTCNKTGVIGTPTLDLSTKTIHIPIISTLAYYTNYQITIQSGMVQNTGDNVDTFGYSANTNSITASFTTEPTLVTPPVIQNSSINGLTNQSRTLTEIVFPISNFIGTTIKDVSKITCDHAVIGTPTISGNAIHIPITSTLDYLTTYNVSINANAIQNNGDGISALSNNPNTNNVTCTFTTVDRPVVSAPVISQSSLDNATNQETTLSEIIFDVSNATNLTLADGLKVSSSPSGIVGTATLVGNTIHIPLYSLNAGTTYTVSILAGIVKNNGDNITTSGSTLNSNSVTATFKTKAGNVSAPVIQQSSLNGQTNQQITLSEITFPVSNAINTTLKNGSRVGISPSGSIGVASLSSNTLHVPLSGLTYSTTYSVTVLDAIVTNNGDGVTSSGTADNINTVTASFTTRAILSAPTLTSATATSYPQNTTQIIYTISQSGCTLVDSNKITVTGANKGTVTINGTQLIISIGGLVSGNTATIHIDSGAISNTDGVMNVSLADYTFSVTDATVSLPPHIFEIDIDWTLGVSYLNLTTVSGYSPTNPLSIANYTAQKIQIYYLGVTGDLNSGIPPKNEKIYCKDFESTSADNSMLGKWYITTANVLRFTKAPTTGVRIKLIQLS